MVKNKLEKLTKKTVEEIVSKLERPFGLFLSGGVDSSLLAALTKPDIVFTCRFPYGERYDEFDSVQKVVSHLNLKQEVITPTKDDFLTYLPEAVNMFKPTTHFSLVPLYMLFKKAKEMGIKTILSGEGPDEYLGGYTNYVPLIHEQRLYEQEELQNYKRTLDKYLGSPIERFARLVNKKVEELQPYWDKYEHLVSKMGYTDLHIKGIEDMELALAKGFGINLVYPFMNPELEKFCFEEVPDKEKIKDFTTKYVWKKIAEKYIPKEVVWRKNKMGGPVAPVGVWLDQKDEYDKTKYLELQNHLWKKPQ